MIGGGRGGWSIYTGPNFVPDLQMKRKDSGRLITTRLHNEMDQPVQNKPKQYSYCRNENCNKENYPFR